jgi:hypothetical protein
MLEPDQLGAMLDFIWARAEEDERRATCPPSRDPVLEAIARTARTMVLLTRTGRASPEPSVWFEVLQKTAELHEDHPDYRPEWRRR